MEEGSDQLRGEVEDDGVNCEDGVHDEDPLKGAFCSFREEPNSSCSCVRALRCVWAHCGFCWVDVQSEHIFQHLVSPGPNSAVILRRSGSG